MNLEIDIQNASDGINNDLLPENKNIEQWVRAILGKQTQAVQLTIRIVNEDESAKLNETYRHKQGATNVLSFPYDGPELLQPPLLGDIVICAPIVIAEAQQQHKDILAHWAHLVIHGVLHLLNYDHQTEKQAQDMENLEKMTMNSLGFDDPYKENND